MKKLLWLFRVNGRGLYYPDFVGIIISRYKGPLNHATFAVIKDATGASSRFASTLCGRGTGAIPRCGAES